jgi:hypothetical protein
VVGNGRVDVVVRSRVSLGRLQISVNGRDVKRYFRRSGGAYRATLRLGRGLQPGVDRLVVTGAGAARTNVIVARGAKLLTLTPLRIGGAETPVRVLVRPAQFSTLQVWVNGHRDEGAFQPRGGVYVGRLGANDFLRPGRNRLVVLSYRTSPSGRAAVFQETARTFQLRPGQLRAGAGPDQFINAGDFVQLEGTASRAPGPAPRQLTYRWEVVSRPRGAPPTLTGPTDKTAGFRATAPGQYLIRTRVRAGNGATSFDTVTVTVRLDIPPIGAQLDTVADDKGTIKLGGNPIPDTTPQCDPASGGCNNRASYAVFNRQTLELVTSGNVASPNGMTDLLNLANKYNAAPTYLMVVNLRPSGAGSMTDGRKLLEALGVAKMSDSDLTKLFTRTLPISIVGVPGSPAGSAFISNSFLNCKCDPARHLVNMSGYLRLNPLSGVGDFEFVFTDQLEFDTNASPTASQITMKVGSQTYAHDAPTDGSSGFFLVRLNSQTLALDKDFFYVTNKPDGSEIPAEAKRMADDIAWASSPNNNDHGELLILLQGFGKPKGTSAGWLQAGQAIGNLGGSAQVFTQLNRGGSLEAGSGRYAFVARSAMDTAAAESSQALTGRATDGRLHGLIARGRDAQYEPLMADPLGTVNFDLVRILNRPSLPDGGFPKFEGGQANAANFLGRDKDIVGVCDAAPAPCDIRKAYYENFAGTNWGTILARLGNDATKAKCAAGGPGFTATDCNAVRQQLELEIGRRNIVEEYFGPKGLQGPFLGGVQVAALVDIGKIADRIRTAVQPPPADNATSHALNIVSFLVKIGGLAGVVFPPAGAAAAGVGAAFGMAAYLTKQDGSPDLIGPMVTTAAANLGGDLYDRYQRASAYFTTEAKIIMSDYSKMSDVAAVATSSTKWKLDDIAKSTASMRLATQQEIYQALLPVAYPFLYDLGTGVAHATDWICRSPGPLYDKRLFQNTGRGAEITWRMTSGGDFGKDHLLVLGARHTVGSLHSAYIPAPPEDLTGDLFRDPAAPKPGGIGLYRLAFYSPQYFRVFPQVLQQRLGKPDRHGHRAPYGYQTCQSFPDPPGNSG